MALFDLPEGYPNQLSLQQRDAGGQGIRCKAEDPTNKVGLHSIRTLRFAGGFADAPERLPPTAHSPPAKMTESPRPDHRPPHEMVHETRQPLLHAVSSRLRHLVSSASHDASPA